MICIRLVRVNWLDGWVSPNIMTVDQSNLKRYTPKANLTMLTMEKNCRGRCSIMATPRWSTNRMGTTLRL
jgi:hypothetical protein